MKIIGHFAQAISNQVTLCQLQTPLISVLSLNLCVLRDPVWNAYLRITTTVK